MNILFVSPVAAMSISDVARGFRSALERAGHNVRDYSMRGRFAYHAKAVPLEVQADPSVVSRQASETILNEAMYHESDLVIIVSGLNIHPIALWLLGKVGIPVAVIFTESPYDDGAQRQWADLSHVGSSVDITIFTNDRFSAEAMGWHFLPPAFDPAIHRPVPPDPDADVEFGCDVMMVGTGWPERQAILEAVNWDGIDLRLHGLWPGITAESPLHRFYHPSVVDNARIASVYGAAKICLNFHRVNPHALTPGPRVYELAACGAFQISDTRPDLRALFGPYVPEFTGASHLETLIREYLPRTMDDTRRTMAEEARQRVRHETFDHRAAELISVMSEQTRQLRHHPSPSSPSTSQGA